jgi:hypothetical protein
MRFEEVALVEVFDPFQIPRVVVAGAHAGILPFAGHTTGVRVGILVSGEW